MSIEWDKFKQELEINLKLLIEDENKDKEDIETYKVMLSMLNSTKELKNHEIKTKLEI